MIGNDSQGDKQVGVAKSITGAFPVGLCNLGARTKKDLPRLIKGDLNSARKEGQYFIKSCLRHFCLVICVADG